VYRLIKRGLDIVVAATSLIALSPIMAIVALLVRVKMGSPVLFRQVRLGYRNQKFCVYKFRSMRDALGPDGQPLPDEQRLTAFGRFLRKSSLDELPQLWNVLKGDMSLVGPRPLLVEYWDVYSPRERTRQDVRPGITGLAQINGRNQARWDDRLEFDARYVERMSFGLDLYILMMTVVKVLARKDVDFPNQETRPLTHYRVARRAES
jgi:lipopolysaccharide/colanic/teichoic acid biosynthesis glycosyltransferase